MLEQGDGPIDIHEVEWPGVSNDHHREGIQKADKGKYKVSISGLDKGMLDWQFNAL